LKDSTVKIPLYLRNRGITKFPMVSWSRRYQYRENLVPRWRRRRRIFYHKYTYISNFRL